MNPPTLQRRTRHRNPHDGTTTAEVRGLFTIILLAISVIHFRFDQMTTPQPHHRTAPHAAQRGPRAEQVRPENGESACGQTETSPAGWRGRLPRRPDRLVSALGAVDHGASLHTRIRIHLT
jgi:hypothetical protein